MTANGAAPSATAAPLVPGPAVAPELSRAHRQVLAFVGAYLHGYDCLPTTTEVAQACGLRSSRSAARLLKDLEVLGVLERDPRYSRLGQIRSVGSTAPISERDQLWLCELARLEVSANLEALRLALGFAIDAVALSELHSDGFHRSLELQAYDDVRRRLTEAGVVLSETDRVGLEQQREIAELSHTLIIDWSAYCIVRLIWTLSAQQWLSDVDPFRFGYVGTSLMVSHRTYAALLPTYRARAAGPLLEDERAPMIIARLSELLVGFRAGMVRHTPAHTQPTEVDVAALLTAR